ncbi:class I SAM-dependent methyltransferase [Campylobacter sp. FMV-PI01]|uniref:Class I SAM-dependent methyltransferase n=1 Tax=Campylobacter portucalensis TaxID=2608384 RepID=A0A6L5WHH8_9BACT|nr:class I SAM-dependent methyltransferase [Campylobacter portucalensis]MSN96504.1 class I SAM-dependent methyltransferase [Campylobacter portucalensis]
MNDLDFYAKIEPILGLNEAKNRLYEIYLDEISNLKFSGFKGLDFGCGAGDLALRLAHKFKMLCLDKSDEMVNLALKNGLNAKNLSIFELNEKFDLIISSFDVLNYMKKDEMVEFLSKIPELLNENGYFIFDINTKFGFEEIAQGLLYEEDEDGNSLIIDAVFENEILKTDMILFEKRKDCFYKIKKTITQVFHQKSFIQNNLNLKLLNVKNINLYSKKKADKIIFIFKKINN